MPVAPSVLAIRAVANAGRLAAGAAALPAAPRLARAETYPSRPVRLIVGAVPGSAPDVIARLIAQSLAQRLGQSFVVENRSGASGNLATEAVARAAPDGYTLLLVSAGNAINTSLYENLNFDLIRDVAPVAGIVHRPVRRHSPKAHRHSKRHSQSHKALDFRSGHEV